MAGLQTKNWTWVGVLTTKTHLQTYIHISSKLIITLAKYFQALTYRKLFLYLSGIAGPPPLNLSGTVEPLPKIISYILIKHNTELTKI
jgi:hypothetical protein